MEKMKRLILALCCLFVLVGCSKTEPIPDKAEATYVGGLDYYLPLAEEHDFKDESVEITGEYTKKLFTNSCFIGDVDSDFLLSPRSASILIRSTRSKVGKLSP